ncbi:MAG: phosphoribosylanthranilate isomerase [Hyphomicrobiaceae bacterium]|nr:phosphoribosylanthranilate isomerase [Hyphomicrobiaceae bacterium]
MSVKVKICGLKTRRALDAALEAGADYFGLVFYARSPRNVDHDTAAALAERGRGTARSVALLVNPDDDEVRQVCDIVSPDFLQLHGSEPLERLEEIRAIANRPLIKAVKVESAPDVDAALVYESTADMLLFDAKAPPDMANALPGGNGVAFDWRALRRVKGQANFMLSGGLTPDNVATAVAITHAPVVDVSSGVERQPGEKDDDLVRKFIAAAKSAAPAKRTSEPENV